ncbi:MAG: hypothetical protein L0227_09795 [Chloroflexi bacterium]|nr:hypothetical protein [Chloroflexota bacterium]
MRLRTPKVGRHDPPPAIDLEALTTVQDVYHALDRLGNLRGCPRAGEPGWGETEPCAGCQARVELESAVWRRLVDVVTD